MGKIIMTDFSAVFSKTKTVMWVVNLLVVKMAQW